MLTLEDFEEWVFENIPVGNTYSWKELQELKNKICTITNLSNEKTLEYIGNPFLFCTISLDGSFILKFEYFLDEDDEDCEIDRYFLTKLVYDHKELYV